MESSIYNFKITLKQKTPIILSLETFKHPSRHQTMSWRVDPVESFLLNPPPSAQRAALAESRVSGKTPPQGTLWRCPSLVPSRGCAVHNTAQSVLKPGEKPVERDERQTATHSDKPPEAPKVSLSFCFVSVFSRDTWIAELAFQQCWSCLVQPFWYLHNTWTCFYTLTELKNVAKLIST